MKIRTCFVSNSSTSSYVIVGYRSGVDINKAMKELDLKAHWEFNETGFYAEGGVFGMCLGSISDDGFPGTALEKDKVLEAFDKMSELAKKLGILEEPKLIMTIGEG